jgi:MoxR-like ATPase
MAERQITVGKITYPLPKLFMVMATQNPIEQEGTYPLPEAQLDRFLMHVTIDYPHADAEQQILQLARDEAREINDRLVASAGDDGEMISSSSKISQQSIFEARNEILDVHMAENLEQYLLHLVLTTRNPAPYGSDMASWCQYGASPRATIALDRCSRAHAWLDQRDYVTPEDIQAIAFDVLRHRIILSYEAEADGITTDDFIHELTSRVAVP